MSEYLVDQVLKKIKEVYPLYYRLIFNSWPGRKRKDQNFTGRGFV